MNLSLHARKSHKVYLYKEVEDNSFLDSILKLDMYECQININSDLILFDIDKKEIIQEFNSLESFCFDKYSPEIFTIKGLHPNFFLELKIPCSINSLNIDGGDYMSEIMKKTDVFSKIWDNYLNLAQKARFTTTLEERLKNESEMRNLIKNIETLKLDSPIYTLLGRIIDSNITELSIRWVYLSKREINLLNNFKKIQTLELRYNYNDDFSELKFPNSLKDLIIYGTTIESLSEINFEGLKLEILCLEANTIKDLSNLKMLPNTIEVLALDTNHIKGFSIADLPENLKKLYLNFNQIDNSFFEGINSNVVNSNITDLEISNNQLKINNWLLYRITETFPMLDYIDLTGNEICGIPEELLINSEESSSIAQIKYWMTLQEYQCNTCSYLELKDTFNYYGKTNTIILNWRHKLLPSKIILSDIQDQFKQYLGEMPKFKMFREGLYCDIEHDKISLIIREDIGDTGLPKNITLELYAADRKVYNTYFYKYFSEIKRLVELNTHHNILPVNSFSTGCEVYKNFFNFVYHIDKKIKGESIILANESVPKFLINIDKISEKPQYKKIDSVAFVIKVGHFVFPFILDENNYLCNYHSKYKNEYFKIKIKEPEEKVYCDILKNEYLGIFCFVESFLFATLNKNQKNSVFYNPEYFMELNGKLICIDSKIVLNIEKLAFPENENKRLILEVENNVIFVKKYE